MFSGLITACPRSPARMSSEPVEVILTAVQTATPSPRSADGARPAFKLANKTSMNLDGPGYALTLLLVGRETSSMNRDLIVRWELSGQIVILGMAFMNGLGGNSTTSRAMVRVMFLHKER